MDKLMTLGIALTAIDKFTKPLEKINGSIGSFAKKASKISIGNLESELDYVRKKAKNLDALKLKLEYKLKRSSSNAEQLKRDIKRVQTQLGKLNQKELSLTSKIKESRQQAEMLNDRLKKTGLSISKYSALSAAGGSMVIKKLTETVMAYKDVQKAQGDLASLNMNTDGIEDVTRAAKEMSTQYANVTMPSFIRASYDIRSGISSLSDEGVAKFTKLATLTARATKSSSEEMTKLFALGYGIFKRAGESDFDFGERFSASIAKAVQDFRTDGSDLTQGLSNIGAVAKSMGVSLEEELAVIGTSKDAFNSAAEAGTAYRAFLGNAVQAQQKLGVSLTDTHGKLLPMRMILGQLRKKFGDIDALEMKQLKEAFGSEEAVKIITALIDKTDQLEGSEKRLLGAKLKNVDNMAKARNKGEEFTIMMQRLQAVSISIGKVASPVFGAIAEKVGQAALWIDKLVSSSGIGKWIVYTVGALGVLSVTLGTVGLAVGAFTAYIGFAGKALSLFSVLSRAGAVGMVLLQAAMSPVVLIAAAIAGAVYLIIDNWGVLATWFSQMWQGIASIFESAASWVTMLMNSPVEAISVAWASLVSWFGSFLESVKTLYKDGASYIGNIFTSPVKWIKSVWFELLAWLGKKIDSIKGVVNAVSRFVGQGDVFKIGVDASGAPDSNDGAFVAKAKEGDTSKKTLSTLKDIADNTSLKRPKIADFVPTKKIKHGKISGGNRGKMSGSSAGTDSIRSSDVSGGRGGNAYTINIRILGNEPADIAVKLKSLLPSLIKDIEQNTLARGMYDL